MSDSLVVGNLELKSRLIVGTGKYKGLEETRAALEARGLEFRGVRVGFSEIGGTTRFDDPSGHRLCLYVPSEESLTWGSGPKVLEIAGGQAAAR